MSLVMLDDWYDAILLEIPQFIREAGMISHKSGGIAITQPRRVAAVNLAKRVAEETVTQLGGQVKKTKGIGLCWI